MYIYIHDFLNKMKDVSKVSEQTYLATMDLKLLYTNSPNSESKGTKKSAKVHLINKQIKLELQKSHHNNFSNYTYPKRLYFQLQRKLFLHPLFMAEFGSKCIYPLKKNTSMLDLQH